MNAPRPAPHSAPSEGPAPLRFVASRSFLPPGQVSYGELLARARQCQQSLDDIRGHQRVGPELEREAFRLYNWLKQRSELLRTRLGRGVAAAVCEETCRSLEDAAIAIRNELAARFLPLVIGTARKVQGAHVYSNDELVSELAETLLGVIGNFDADRGFRFSTYATLAIRRQTLRMLRTAARQQQDAALDVERTEAPAADSERAAQQKWDVSQQLLQLIEGLEPREQVILRARLGIDGDSPRRPSLRRLGERLGLSRERIRQLEQRALRRIRQAASQRNISLTP